MERAESLTAELARDFDIVPEELSPELQLCVARLEELRRRDGDTPITSGAPIILRAPSKSFPITLSIADDPATLEDIFKLRARAFEQAGWLSSETDTITDEFDTMPTAILVAAHSGGRLVGTLRVSVNRGREKRPSMPCELEFVSELASIASEMDGARMAEFGRVAIDPEIANSSFRATLYGSLVRAGMLAAWASDVDYTLVAVHNKIARFYQYMIGFKRIAQSSSYGIIAHPTQLLGLDFPSLIRKSDQRSGFFQVTREEAQRVRQQLRLVNQELWANG